MEQVIVEVTSTVTVAIALFGAVFSLAQTKYSRVSKSFAAFLAAITANNFADGFAELVEVLPSAVSRPAELILGLPSSLMLAPLFWIYVYTLTSPTQRYPSRLYLHLFLPILAMLVGLIIAIFAPEVWETLYEDAPLPTSALPFSLLLTVIFLQLALYPPIGIYLFLIIQRLMRHRLRLRDVYASTEKHELRWIYVIGGLSFLFWIVLTSILFFAFGTEQSEAPTEVVVLSSLVGLALVSTTTFWGLRQRPPLVPDIEFTETNEPIEEAKRSLSEQVSEKYEKSALSPEASKRITGKLRAAMEKDHLHRDANLSLWTLARHIGASPNYISQTLNEEIGESFFDFVNGYRIAEAKVLLTTTNDTVLSITYDVGFNARSSFYNSFKRVTGQTPTNYRKSLSRRDGMDDEQA